MNEFLQVLVLALVAGVLTYLGAPVAEFFDLPQKAISSSLQFAAGIITALVAFSLMPPAAQYGHPVGVAVGFFIGGALYVFVDIVTSQIPANESMADSSASSLGLYIGVLVDLIVDGVVIGVASTLTFTTGLLLAIGLAVGTAPLAFITIATAKHQGMALHRRRQLSYLFIVCIVAGAMLGYLLLRNQPVGVQMVMIAIASGFLFTTVTQTMIPEAVRSGGKGYDGLLYIGGLSIFALATLAF